MDVLLLQDKGPPVEPGLRPPEAESLHAGVLGLLLQLVQLRLQPLKLVLRLQHKRRVH